MSVQPYRVVALSTIFALTGMAIALPGALLPAMMQQWGMSDRGGGLLLLLAWSGSTAAVLFTRGRMEWSVVRGMCLATAAMLGLGTATRLSALALSGAYGLGVGITMTSISILRSKEVQPERSALEMNRLNMLWAVGACFGPLIALRGLRTVRVVTVFVWLGAAFALALLSLLATQREGIATQQPMPERRQASVPVWICLFASLAVGAESSLGGWLTTFAGRSTHTAGLAVSVNSAFWAGLLISRAAHASASLHFARSRVAILLHAALAVVATGSLLMAPRDGILFLIATTAGLGLGPLYPYALSISLSNYRPTAIFIMAGAGSAVFPWLTGATSTGFGSLRIGLVIPFVASLALLMAYLKIDRAENRVVESEPA